MGFTQQSSTKWTVETNLQQDAVELCLEAMNLYKTEREIAELLKKEFDRRYEELWHCIVGRKFACYISHEEHFLVQFYVRGTAVVLFKAGSP
ncbi:unnamed protein product [Dicrocoelium dendriticum]|nr:unnamed protein product [Dicrocoelium dendriticum]